jgi:hypothetical protein
LRQEWPVVETFAKELIAKQELDYEAIDTLLKDLKGGTPPPPPLMIADAGNPASAGEPPVTGA